MSRIPETFEQALRDRLSRESGRPLLTFYDQADPATPGAAPGAGERVELSVTTYANWVAKAAGMLAELGFAERGSRVRISLPPHWLGPVFLGAAWSLGSVVTWDEDVELVVCGPQEVPRWAARAAEGLPVFACSLRPLGVRFAEPLPDGVLDVGAEIWAQPDAFVAPDPPSGDDPALADPSYGELSQRALFAAAAAGAVLPEPLPDGSRLLTTANPASPPGWPTFIEPLLRRGSVILVSHLDPDRLDATMLAERATATFLPSPGQPTRS